MKHPTEASYVGQDSVATLIPLLRVVIWKGLEYLRGSGIFPNSRSPKFFKIGALEN
jgi:hypothetical protein